MEATRKVLFVAAAVVLLAMLALPPLTGFSVDLGSFQAAFVLAAVLGAFLPYVHWRKLTPMVPALESMALGMALTPAVIALTYVAMRLNLPLADGLLIRADESLGLDWPAFIHWIDSSALAANLLFFAYLIFGPELILLPALLCAVGLPLRAYQVTLGWLLIGVFASAITSMFPSIAAYAGHGMTQDDLGNINIWLGTGFLDSFTAVRSQPDFVLGVTNASGIVSFPSIHAGAAILCIWAAWPSRLLRYPVLVLNALMIVAAIPYGAHYFVDIIAGCTVAAVVIAVMNRIASKSGARAAGHPRLHPAIDRAA
jgi:membrane-associated phospholipid phosphatase